MRSHSSLIVTAAALLGLGLSGCGGSSSSDDSSSVAVDDLPAGRYVVAVGDASAPTAGKYYAAGDGTRLLVLSDGDDRATQTYRRAAGQSWQAVPATSGAPVTLLSHSVLPGPSPTLAVASIAGNYIAPVGNGKFARFAVGADGQITAGATACKLSGRLTPSALPQALNAKLTATDCGDLPTTTEGSLIADDDYAPARFRLVSDDDRRTLELWAYAE